MKEKEDIEIGEEKKTSSIGKYATLRTLSDEELAEANGVDTGDEEIDDEEAEFEEDYSENAEDVDDWDSSEEEPEAEEKEEEEPRLEHFGPTIVLKSKPTEEDIFRFMFRHTYCSALGIIAAVMSVAAIVIAVLRFMVQDYIGGILFAAMFYLFAIHSPISLKKKAKKQSQEMCSPEGTITYTFSDAGFDMERGDEYAPYKWSRIIKIVNGKTGYYVYLEKNRAFIATKAGLAENEQLFVEMLRKNVVNCKL